jgi:hypothetical protein
MSPVPAGLVIGIFMGTGIVAAILLTLLVVNAKMWKSGFYEKSTMVSMIVIGTICAVIFAVFATWFKVAKNAPPIYESHPIYTEVCGGTNEKGEADETFRVATYEEHDRVHVIWLSPEYYIGETLYIYPRTVYVYCGINFADLGYRNKDDDKPMIIRKSGGVRYDNQ